MKVDTYIEDKSCVHGERNFITKEVFCNRFCEFCKFINCNLKQNNNEQRNKY